MRARCAQKIENTSSEQISLDDVLKLCLPLAQDGLASSSPVWNKFLSVIYNNQGKIQFNNWVIIAQSYSAVKGFADNKFWKVV